MGFVAWLNRLIDLVFGTFKQFGRGGVWLVLLVWFLVGWLLLLAHYHFTSPVFYGLISAWTSVFSEQAGAGFTHYPGHFLMMPYFFGWAKLVAGLVLEGAVLGAAALMFYRAYVARDERLESGSSESTVSATVLRFWAHLVLAWVVLNGLIVLFNMAVAPDILDPLLRYSPRRQMFFDYVVLPGVYTLFLALFFFTIPSIVIYGESVFSALKRSFGIFFRNPFTCLVMAFVVMFVPVVIARMTDNAALIVTKFRPELVYWLLLVGLLADMVANFFWMGLAVRFLAYEEE